MKATPHLERSSWIAGIIGAIAGIIGLGYTIIAFHRPQPSDLSQNHNSNVLIEGDRTYIAGDWNLDKAQDIAESILKSASWVEITSEKAALEQHALVGEFNLVYSLSEGMILVYASKNDGDDCHACAPYLSFFEFDKNDKKWVLMKTTIAGIHDGAFGEPPFVNVFPIANDKYGVFLELNEIHQGWTVGGTRIFTQMGDSFREVFHIITSQGKPEGTSGFSSWHSVLALKPTITGLYDIEVTRKGARGPKDLVFMDGRDELKDAIANSDGNVRPYDLYKFNGQRYVRALNFK